MTKPKPIAGNQMQGLDKTNMYWIKSQPWVPHYVTKDVYVAPGGFEKTERELLDLKATKTPTMLWPRAWQFAKGGLK